MADFILWRVPQKGGVFVGVCFRKDYDQQPGLGHQALCAIQRFTAQGESCTRGSDKKKSVLSSTVMRGNRREACVLLVSSQIARRSTAP